MVTEIDVSTVTEVGTAGMAEPAESVTVTVSWHVVVVPVGAYVRAATPEFEKPGQLPDATDHAKL